ncbi:MAG: hypothetical protein GF320_18845, partial [Armatimonadia bacterium]|nr:hypothetical protein [Armatimonadia bacterium]
MPRIKYPTPTRAGAMAMPGDLDNTPRDSPEPSPEALSPSGAPGRAARVEGAGRCDRLADSPYGELYWFEGRRAGFPSPSSWWRFDGAGIVGTAARPNAPAESTAAAAVDAARQALARGASPAEVGQDTRSVSRVVGKAIRSASKAVRARAAASDEPIPHTCSLMVAAVQKRTAAVGRAGEGGAYLIRSGICQRVSEVADDHSGPADETPDLLGDNDGVTPAIWTLSVEAGDLLLLLSGGAEQAIGDPDEIEDFISECGTLEEACERILVEAKLRKAEGANSVVLLGVDLDPASALFVDPSRDRLPYYFALRGAELQGPAGPQLASGRDLLQLMGPGGSGQPAAQALEGGPSRAEPPPGPQPPPTTPRPGDPPPPRPGSVVREEPVPT